MLPFALSLCRQDIPSTFACHPICPHKSGSPPNFFRQRVFHLQNNTRQERKHFVTHCIPHCQLLFFVGAQLLPVISPVKPRLARNSRLFQFPTLSSVQRHVFREARAAEAQAKAEGDLRHRAGARGGVSTTCFFADSQVSSTAEMGPLISLAGLVGDSSPVLEEGKWETTYVGWW